MNGKRTDFGDDHEEHFDPELAALFDETHDTPLDGSAFTARVFGELQRARRRRLLRGVFRTTIVLTAGAFAAPFVGELTFAAAGWLAENVSTTGLVLPAASAMAALITWRIARRGYQ